MWADAAFLSETLGAAPSARDAAEADDAGFIWTLLPRHGRRPVRFLGREMLRADNRAAARAGALTHWSGIHIYEVFAGGFVTALRHLRLEDDHASFQDAWTAVDPRGVIAALRAHDIGAALPVDEALSHPPVISAWQRLVGTLFAADQPA